MPTFKKNSLICPCNRSLLIERAGREYRQTHLSLLFIGVWARAKGRIHYLKYAYWIFFPSNSAETGSTYHF